MKDVDQEHEPCRSREFNLVRNLVSGVSCGWNRSWTIVRKARTVFEQQLLWMYHVRDMRELDKFSQKKRRKNNITIIIIK